MNGSGLVGAECKVAVEEKGEIEREMDRTEEAIEAIVNTCKRLEERLCGILTEARIPSSLPTEDKSLETALGDRIRNHRNRLETIYSHLEETNARIRL